MAMAPFLCARCTRALRQPSRALALRPTRQLSQSLRVSCPAHSTDAAAATSPSDARNDDATPNDLPPRPPDPEKSPMARRLEEATEEALLSGGRAGKRAIEEAGFDEELKARLLDKLAEARFTSENSAALAEAGVASNIHIHEAAGEGTRRLAASQPWTGEETTEDTVLRMLNDARKPLAPGLRGKPNIPSPVVDMRVRRGPVVSAGHRAASARDKAQAYAGMGLKDVGLSEAERESVKREFRERFQPGARAMPNTLTGLAALANERIEDAIARGQFKDIPRGKGIERDTRADNPFIDTTEYIMNKMIKRQEIVPPWIEKQQELLKAARVFRLRLRNDWRRHAARVIASRGGSLQEQMRRAEDYARAEEVHNPRRKNVDEISVPTNTTDDAVMVSIRQQPWTLADVDEQVPEDAAEEAQPVVSRPFRDPNWEATERSYMELAISNLNAITRSYNLMAPELAKKPYFSLRRELDNCFAEVAPQLANVIKERAAQPNRNPNDALHRPRAMFERLGSGSGEGSARVYDSPAPHYGLKQFWRDLWSPQK
ncbi:hypothetical protein B0T16DRAFT_423279 [Cercophora newfieldiana]|uniref:DnaJ homologue subfamily C member 28 conserved domain-containing protein n=1 Tax=Cercophora newfieldiana TaxID=92897 RepID=A0AA39XSM8_9PEZI|nr:hypothetical protein B0T16DRAFT_423279 [Cercophora newfieldiana]